MAQNSVSYSDNPTGPELLDNYLAKEQENILSSNSGIQRPSYAAVGTCWLDTSVSPWQYKLYDGSEDVVFGTINSSTHNFIVSGIDDSNMVHITGTETITGTKTFQGNNRILHIQNSSVTYNTAPSSNTFTDISFKDVNGQEIGIVESIRYTSNITGLRLGVRGADNGYSLLEVSRNSNGQGFTEAPTPTDSTTKSGTQIATTGWVNNTNNNVVHKDSNETIAGTKTFSSSPVIPTPAVSSNTTVAASTAYINNKFKKVNSLPASPDANTFYFIPE